MRPENKQNTASGSQGGHQSPISLVRIDVFPSTRPRRANSDQISSSSVVSELTTFLSDNDNQAWATGTRSIPIEHPKPKYGYNRFSNIELPLHEEQHLQEQRRMSAGAAVQAPQVELCLPQPPVCLDGVTDGSGSSVSHCGGSGTDFGTLQGTGEQNYAETFGTGSVRIDEPAFDFYNCGLISTPLYGPPEENATPAYVFPPDGIDCTALLQNGEGNGSQFCLQESDMQAIERAISGEVQWLQYLLYEEDEEALEKTMEWMTAEGW